LRLELHASRGLGTQANRALQLRWATEDRQVNVLARTACRREVAARRDRLAHHADHLRHVGELYGELTHRAVGGRRRESCRGGWHAAASVGRRRRRVRRRREAHRYPLDSGLVKARSGFIQGYTTVLAVNERQVLVAAELQAEATTSASWSLVEKARENFDGPATSIEPDGRKRGDAYIRTPAVVVVAGQAATGRPRRTRCLTACRRLAGRLW
jgi:hypothetical protein